MGGLAFPPRVWSPVGEWGAWWVEKRVLGDFHVMKSD